MRKIKSAPANLCAMINRKKMGPTGPTGPTGPRLPIFYKINNNEFEKSELEKNELEKNEFEKNELEKNEFEKSELEKNELEKIINENTEKTIKLGNKRRLARIVFMSLSDGFSQISKLNPILDEHFEFNSIIESSLEYANSRMTKENLEYFIYSLIVRYIISNIYHDIIEAIEKICTVN